MKTYLPGTSELTTSRSVQEDMNGKPRDGSDNKGYLSLRILANIKVAVLLIRCPAVVTASSRKHEDFKKMIS